MLPHQLTLGLGRPVQLGPVAAEGNIEDLCTQLVSSSTSSTSLIHSRPGEDKLTTWNRPNCFLKSHSSGASHTLGFCVHVPGSGCPLVGSLGASPSLKYHTFIASASSSSTANLNRPAKRGRRPVEPTSFVQVVLVETSELADVFESL